MRLRTYSSFHILYLSLSHRFTYFTNHCNVQYIAFGLEKHKHYKVLNAVTRKYLNYYVSTYYYTYI